MEGRLSAMRISRIQLAPSFPLVSFPKAKLQGLDHQAAPILRSETAPRDAAAITGCRGGSTHGQSEQIGAGARGR